MLSDIDRATLDVEAQHWRHAGTKEAAIREQLGMSSIRYYQRLARLADDPDAIAYAPAVTRRLRSIKDRAPRR